MIYIFGWVVNYFFLLLPQRLFKKKYGAALSLFVLACIVILRGRVGTDVGGTYEPMVADLNNIRGTEPLFLALLHLLKPIFPTALLTVTMGVGSVFILLLFAYLVRADENEVFLFQAFYVPAMFLEQSISGQRFGIAFAILMIMIQCVRLKQFKTASLLALVALFTHYSSAVFLVFWAAMFFRFRRTGQFVAVIAGVAIFSFVAAFAQVYFLLKYNLYFESGYEKPSMYSGLSVVLITVVMAAGISSGPLTIREKVKIVSLTILGLGGFWMIGLYSYGALRLLTLVELAVPFAALALFAARGFRFDAKFKAVLILAGLLGAGFTYKDMLVEASAPSTTSPALPYRFFWDESSN